MSAKYYTGIDVSNGSDYTAVCVSRTLYWYEKLWFWLKREKAPHLKIVSLDTYAEPNIRKDKHE